LEIYRNLEKTEYPQSIALGFFDGVHLGHKAVIESAAKFSGKKAVLTFSEHPEKVLKNKAPSLLISNEKKLCELEKAGVDAVYLLDFSEIMNMDAKSFVKDILIDTLNAKMLSCGYNYRFGKGGMGDTNLIKEISEKENVEVNVISEILYENREVSSTKIRKLIENGEIILANKMLGRNFGFETIVEHGRRIGSSLGFPTINQKYPEDLVLPKFGVYVSQTLVDGKFYRSITNIGIKPTVKSDYVIAETNIFDFSKDLYGKKLELELLDFLREERKFESLDELRKTIADDCEKARNFIK